MVKSLTFKVKRSLEARLISKLEAYGVRGNLSLWLSNFLTNRFQRVVVNGLSQIGLMFRVEYLKVQSWFPCYLYCMSTMCLTSLRVI